MIKHYTKYPLEIHQSKCAVCQMCRAPADHALWSTRTQNKQHQLQPQFTSAFKVSELWPMPPQN